MADTFTEVFVEIIELSRRMGVSKISSLPGCWEVDVDGVWWFAVNGHGKPVKCSHGPEVAPFTAYVEFNGFPAGIVTPRNGVIAAGDAANEAAFISALRTKGGDRG